MPSLPTARLKDGPVPDRRNLPKPLSLQVTHVPHVGPAPDTTRCGIFRENPHDAPGLRCRSSEARSDISVDCLWSGTVMIEDADPNGLFDAGVCCSRKDTPERPEPRDASPPIPTPKSEGLSDRVSSQQASQLRSSLTPTAALRVARSRKPYPSYHLMNRYIVQ